MRALPKLLASWEEMEPEFRPKFVTQRVGETLFVPAGWWQVALNLEESVSVTHNFASRHHFDEVWRLVLARRQDIAEEILDALALREPALAARADCLKEEARRDKELQRQREHGERGGRGRSSSLTGSEAPSSSSSGSSSDAGDSDSG